MFIALVFLGILLVVGAVSSVYRKNWDKNFQITIGFVKDGIFEGENGEVLQVFTNKKLLPVWWGDIKFQISGELKFDDNKLADSDYYRKDPVSVWPYEQVSRKLPFTALKRGYYTIQKADFLTFDMFFNSKFIRPYPQFSELYVYPSRKNIRKFQIDFKKIVGEVVKRRHIVEDPFQFRGIRDYYPFDSLKTVNWNATAKSGDIKVNQYHYSSSQEVMLLVDMDGYNEWDKQEIKEDVIRIAAYLAANLLRNGISVGLTTNAYSATGEEINIPCRNGRSHHLHLLRQMAKIDTGRLRMPFSSYFDDILRKGNTKPQYILISYYGGADLQREADRLRFSGASLQWILLQEKGRKNPLRSRAGLYVCEVDG